jgi:hypothetical protein
MITQLFSIPFPWVLAFLPSPPSLGSGGSLLSPFPWALAVSPLTLALGLGYLSFPIPPRSRWPLFRFTLGWGTLPLHDSEGRLGLVESPPGLGCPSTHKYDREN